MKFIKISAMLLLAAITFSACHSSKKMAKNGGNLDDLYTTLKTSLPEAQVFKMDGMVKVVYPELGMFDFNKDVVKQDVMPSFDRFAFVLKKFPTVKIQIEGYTDNAGPTSVNVDLSSRRATSGKNLMIKEGLDAAKITTKGMGEANPVMSNATDDGRAANRRVEFLLRLP